MIEILVSFIFLNLFSVDSQSTHKIQYNRLLPILKEITKNTKTNQILILFPNDTDGYRSIERISFIQEYPSIISTFEKSIKGRDAVVKYVTILHRKSLILFLTKNLNDVELLFDSRLTILRPLLKNLIIYHGNSSDAKNIEKTLKDAWIKKILDLTILSIDGKNNSANPTVYYYNPFFDSITKKFYHQGVEIFPEKLNNVNKFPIDAGANHPPSTNSFNLKYNNRNSKDCRYDEYLMIKFVMKTIGFNILPFEKINVTKASKPKNHMSIFVVDSHRPVRGHILTPAESEHTFAVAVVPITYVSNENFTEKITYYVIVISIIILGVIYITKRLKVATEFSEVFYNIQIFLSQSVDPEPQKAFGRIIYLTLNILVFLIMNDFYSDIVEMQYDLKQVPFENHEDLMKSNLKVYVPSLDVKQAIIVKQVEGLERISVTVKVLNTDDCIKRLVESKNISCVMEQMRAQFYISQYRSGDGSSVIKAAQPPLYNVEKMYAFDNYALIYRDKFYETLRRIRESGIDYMACLMTEQRYVVHIYEQREEDSEDKKIVPVQLIAILLIGLSVATVAFFIELVVFYTPKVRPYFSFR